MKTRLRPGGAVAYAASALALLALLAWQPAEARAQWTTCGTNNICNTNTGNAGVGTGSNAPGAKLDVGAGAAARGGNTDLLIGAGGNIPQIEFFGANKSAAIQYDDSGGMVFYTNAPSWTQALYLGNSGWVGVGTTSPASQFHVQNSSGVGFVRVTGLGGGVMNFEDSSAASGQRLYQWRSEGGVFRMSLLNEGGSFAQQNILVANSAGNVGIGTASPSYPLDLQFANSGSAIVAHFKNTNAGLNTVVSFDALSNQNANIELANGGVNKWYIRNNASDSVNGNRLSVLNAGGGAEVLSVLQGGNVGIGATNPTHKLEVGGDINAAGAVTGLTINATYQDVAEWVPSTQKLSAGTVVVLDTTRTNSVLASTKPYDTRVAGVVSDNPGVILGQGGADKVKVATTGRVKVKVDATRAPIQVGDLLVTSEAEGVAMKSVPLVISGREMHAPGTIIGKALEPLENGTGEILVLLSLQ